MTKKNKIILTFIIAGLIMVVAISATKPKLQNTTLNGHTVTINNRDIEVMLNGGRDYIIVPVNTKLSKIEILSVDGEYDFTPLNEFIRDIDTLEPQEIEYSNEDLTVNIIVSDDLR